MKPLGTGTGCCEVGVQSQEKLHKSVASTARRRGAGHHQKVLRYANDVAKHCESGGFTVLAEGGFALCMGLLIGVKRHGLPGRMFDVT
ncbi:hypothetical protein [Sinorhizobium arboris]|uniref:hypothetical protein n=1 Tax=Sinorhizobium arboris TaxID=76745 RepID=UPI000485E662|nr:hypothetical protein [Sinorhizobium arboris]